MLAEQMKFHRARPEESRLRAEFTKMGFPEEVLKTVQVYTTGTGLMLFVAREYCGGKLSDPLRWHMSVRGPGRVPTWEELVKAAHEIRPGVPFVLSVPPKHLWMNVHPHVLHLWETGDSALQEEWRVNARGDKPT